MTSNGAAWSQQYQAIEDFKDIWMWTSRVFECVELHTLYAYSCWRMLEQFSIKEHGVRIVTVSYVGIF